MSDTALQKNQYAIGEYPDLPPPPGTTGAVGWMKNNLFDGWVNSILTILTGYLLFSTIPSLLNWTIFDANISASSRAQCAAESAGACWAVVNERFAQFTYGFYPAEERWRPDLTFVLLVLAVLPILFETFPHRGKALIFSALYPFVAYGILLGGTTPTTSDVLWTLVPAAFLIGGSMGMRTVLPKWGELANFLFWVGVIWGAIGVILLISGWLFEPVKTRDIGGFLLTLVIGITGITISLPIGVVLALGRKSDMPIIRWMSTAFIEFIRGVPLITLLFVASTMLNYFLPPQVEFDLLLRVLIMVTLFASAYMAEVIRGGLQAIPRGQFEAADAMGLQYWQSMRLIILPQALKISIPGIVNTFIGLYKDTTLVFVIGMLDPLGISRPILADAAWQGLSTEIYVFLALFYFACCFLMSRYSLHLERRLHTGHER